MGDIFTLFAALLFAISGLAYWYLRPFVHTTHFPSHPKISKVHDFAQTKAPPKA